MMTNKEILMRLEEKMIQTLMEFETKLHRRFPIPELQLKRLGRMAGRSNSVMNIVQLNPDFCRNGHWDYMRDVTLPHELAHIVADTIYSEDYHKKYIDMRYTPHGALWKGVMKVIGLCPHVRHTMDLTGVVVIGRKERVRRPHEYRCGCCLHHVSNLKHRRFQEGKYSMFRCAFCKGELTYLGLVNNSVNN